jgi:hypothetical protein
MDGQWMVTHEHVSAPSFDLDTMQAAPHLQQ